MAKNPRRLHGLGKEGEGEQVIFPHTPFAGSVDTAQSITPNLSVGWSHLAVTWWWCGPPVSEGVAPETSDILFRWNRPKSFADVKGGIIGSRSSMWIAASKVGRNEAGTDSTDFTRDGIPSTRQIDDEWGT